MPASLSAIGIFGCRSGATAIPARAVDSSLYGLTGYVLLVNGTNLDSISDTKGNTWTLLKQSGPLYLWAGKINNAFVAGDTISVSANTISFNSQILGSYLEVGGSFVDRSGETNGTMGGGTTQAFSIDVDTTRYSNELVVRYLGATIPVVETLATIRVQPNGAMPVFGCNSATHQGNSRGEPTNNTPPGTTPANIDYAGTLQTGTAGGTYTWGVILISFIGSDSVNIETTGPGGEDPGSPTVLSRDRGTLGTLRQARVTPTTEQLLVDIYNDAFPEAVDSTVTVESSGVTACLIKVLRGQYPKKTHKGLKRSNTDIWYLSYLHSTSVKYRISRDLGVTWGSMATTIATGYHGFTQDFDMHPLRGLWVTALYDRTNTKWRIVVGSLQDDGTWSFSSVRDLVTSAANAGFLKVRPDGIWEFTYRTSGGSIVTLRCRNLQADGTGSWV